MQRVLLILILSLCCATTVLAQTDAQSDAQAEPTAAMKKTAVEKLKSDDGKLPSIVFMMVDELAYFELSHMGNPKLKTPNIDKMAREGMRFTNALAAAPVCGPLRCCLMTGLHTGHSSMRTNPGGAPMRAGEFTLAKMLKQQGYVTGGFGEMGRWGQRYDRCAGATRV